MSSTLALVQRLPHDQINQVTALKRGTDVGAIRKVLDLTYQSPFEANFTYTLADMSAVFTDLPTMQQQMIQNDTGHHCFANRNCADADTRVMATFGDDFGVLA